MYKQTDRTAAGGGTARDGTEADHFDGACNQRLGMEISRNIEINVRARASCTFVTALLARARRREEDE